MWAWFVVLSLTILVAVAHGYAPSGSLRSVGSFVRLKRGNPTSILNCQAEKDPPKPPKKAPVAKRKAAAKRKPATKRKPAKKTEELENEGPSRTLDAAILKKVQEIEKEKKIKSVEKRNEEEKASSGLSSARGEVVTGSGKWSPIKSTASTTGFREIDEEEDPFMDPFFMPPPPSLSDSDFFGSGDVTDSNKAGQGEWSDWNEDANYFDDEEDDDPGYSGYSKDKSRGRAVGKANKGSTNLFPSRADYAKISDTSSSPSPSSSPKSEAGEEPEQESEPLPMTLKEPARSSGVGAPSPNADAEVILPVGSLQSLAKLEERVDSLQNDLLELKIVNAGLLGVLAITIYALTRPIW